MVEQHSDKNKVMVELHLGSKKGYQQNVQKIKSTETFVNIVINGTLIIIICTFKLYLLYGYIL